MKQLPITYWKHTSLCCTSFGHWRNFHVGHGVHSMSKSKGDDDDIVISGLSGRFPQSSNVEEFKQNLFNKIDMVSHQERFSGKNVPSRFGFIKDMDKFDATFFGVTPKLSEVMDPQQRKLLEVTFEAIVDAGVNPSNLKNTATGVYVGAHGGEAADYHLFNSDYPNFDGYGILGHLNFMMPNRLSYTFDLRGPSLLISTGCSASLIALEAAVQSIKMGNCEAAIVAGAAIHVNPILSTEFLKLGAISPNGTCKSFDNSADGFVRSEAIVAMLIQKKKDAKRAYATIRHIKSNSDGYKREGLIFPSGQAQETLLRQIYAEAQIDPGSVTYFEAHGTGTPAGDPQELNAISNVFCKTKSRKEPLQLGSVKSNMGHGESAAGLCSIAKIVVGIQAGILPANLHFQDPNSYVKHVFDDSLKVVTEATPWQGGLVGISGFGLGGTNCHVILETNPQLSPQLSLSPKEEIPILIPFSGTGSEQSIEESLKIVCSNGKNPEYVGLLHKIFEKNIPGHNLRGYGIVRTGEENIIQVEKYDQGTRPLWFIFPGMGSQWNEMGKDLMKFPVFAESIQRSRTTLKNIGLDLDTLLRPGNPTIFNNIRDSLVSITAVQVALYDTIMSLGLKPDGFIGHSSGEILCAYADGCLSAEETLLVCHARGRAFQEIDLSEPGGMAAIGLSWSQIHEICPPNIYPACNNATTNVSVSGPLGEIRKFVMELQSKGIFAKEINSCNCAPHSPYIYPGMDLLFKYMNEIYQDDRPRSSKWISTCIPQDEWDTPLAQFSSAAYHVYNMGKPVRFFEAMQHIPSDAVVVEIAPHGLFQAVLKGSFSKNNVLVAPMHAMVEDKIAYFLNSIGKLYNAGVDMTLSNLYAPVSFPVSSQTPMISSLVKWDHEQSWTCPIIENMERSLGGGGSLKIDLTEKSRKFLQGHRLDSRIVYPATGYLVMAWQSFAKSLGVEYEDLPVTFENVSFERATFLSEDEPTEFSFALLNGSGAFEIREEGAVVVRGNIQAPENVTKKLFNIPPNQVPQNPQRMSLKTDDIYKELKLRGYNYSGEFRGIKHIDNEGKWAQVGWNQNWVSFLDTVLQTVALSVVTRNTAVPVRLEQVTLNPNALFEYMETHNETDIPVSIHQHLNTIQCPGVEMRGLTAMVIPRQRQAETLSLEEYNFTPYFDDKGTKAVYSINSSVSGLLDLVLENSVTSKLKIVDVFTKAENSLTESVYQIMTSKPRYQAKITMLSVPTEVEKLDEKIKALGNILSKESIDQLIPDYAADLVLLDESSLLAPISTTLNDNGFILLTSILTTKTPEGLLKISEKLSTEGNVSLFKKTPSVPPKEINSLSVDAQDFSWLPKLQSLMASAAKESPEVTSRIYLTSQNDPYSGLVGLVKCLRLESGGQNIRAISDPAGKLELNFQTPNASLAQILQRDLVMNIMKNGTLGSYRHYSLEQDVTLPSKQVEHAYINTLTNGDLTSLRWIESPLKYESQDKGQKLCKVNYASLNFRDIMLATGKLPIDSTTSHYDCVMGFEFSGIDQQGNRVMGMMPSKALATSVLVDPEFIWKIPNHWTLEEAATVPIVYATAYYSLFSRARLEPGQSILIHSGTGGVGQAAISLALGKNCEVFTTVGTPEKRKYIKELFPSLKNENIGNSRDCSFEPQIMQLTKGKGVDVILNSLADDKLQASVRCLGMHGKFLEIGAFDAFQNTQLGMSCFLKNIDFHGIFLNQIFSKSQQEKDSLRTLLTNGIESGVVKPLPRTVFSKDKIQDAFRFMAGGKHMGKVLIKIQDGQDKSSKVEAVPKSYFHPNKSYVIVGGLGGLGLEVANWMVERGAKKLVLVSRSGIKNGYQDLCLRKWQEKGVSVDTPKIDLSSYETAEKFIQDLNLEGPIGGIFNSGLVLKDAFIENQTKEMFEAVTAPKTLVTKNLDKLTRQHCPDLDYFVVFSSGACGRGNAGQSNYGLANSVMEQICENRRQDDLHGLAIQWGVIGEAGFVAEKMLSSSSTGEESFEGTVAQRISSCLEVLDLALQQNSCVYSSMVLADKTRKKVKKDFNLVSTLSSSFGLKNLDKISHSTKLIDLGLDSLLGMELKLTLEQNYDLPLTANEIRGLTFGDLIAIDDGNFRKKNLPSIDVNDKSDMFKSRRDLLVKLHTGKFDDKLFIVHGVEGHPDPMRPLASKLNFNSYGFQLPDDFNSIEEISRLYIQEMKLIQAKGPYKIIGYSSGGTVAYEMIKQLSQHYDDQVSHLIILDGCFNWNVNEEVLNYQTMFKYLLDLVLASKLDSTDLLKFSEKMTSNIEDNIELIMDAMQVKFPYVDRTSMTKYFEKYFKYAQFFLNYKSSHHFNGHTTLIKASQKSYFMSLVSDENHNLEQFCRGPFSAHSVQGDHTTFLLGDDVAKIVNKIWEA